MNQLIENERALLQQDVRQNEAELQRLLHPDFIEVGYSGRTYDFQSTIESLLTEDCSAGYTHAQSFDASVLEDSVILLRFCTAHVSSDGVATRYCKRVSIWMLSDKKWQMRFHQGTPCEAFEVIGDA